MKKIFAILFAILMVSGANAQKLLNESKFWDNWSIGAEGGYQWGDLNNFTPILGGFAGIQATKGITPVVSFEFASQFYLSNTYACPNNDIHLAGIAAIASTKVNLMNWFGGYQGQPRLFEIQARGGIGYLRSIGRTETFGEQSIEFEGENSSFAKLGLDFDFNLGDEKAWVLSVRPAVVLPVTDANGDYAEKCSFQLSAGVAYRFKNSNGKHHFTYGRAYDQAEVDALNARINDARGQVAERDKQIAEKNQRIDELEKALKACESKPATVVTNTVVNTEVKENLECYVYFNQGRTNIAPAQLPNVERIATYLKHHADARVLIKGYASPEGSIEINEKIAAARAEAVRLALIKKYQIDGSRIDAEGQGVGNSFSEPDWNRVSICTIKQ